MEEEQKKTKFMDQAINDEILEKLSLKNRYAFLNTNLNKLQAAKHLGITHRIPLQ